MSHSAASLMAGAFVSLSLAAGADPIRLTVSPPEALIDETMVIRLEGAPAGAEVLFRATAATASGTMARSEATYRASARGIVDVSSDPALGGSYAGVQPMGLFWTLQPPPGAAPAAARDGFQELLKRPAGPAFPRPVRGPLEVRIEAVAGGLPLAAVTATRLFTGRDVVVTDVREGGLVGRLYEPPGQRHAALLVLGGSSGGIQQTHAPILAAHGYVTLSLAYFREEGLPQDLIEIPLEYVKRGLDWLRARPSVDPGRVGVLGVSRGAELALLMGATYPADVKAVVAVSPSHVVWEGAVRDPARHGLDAIRAGRSAWTRNGQPLPFAPKTISADTERHVSAGEHIEAIDLYAPTLADRAAIERARIPVENITAAVLLTSGRDDRMWPSAPMAEDVAARMRAGGRRVEHLSYEPAGHVLPDGWMPTPYGGSIGGTAEANARAFADAWPKLLAFLESALGNRPR